MPKTKKFRELYEKMSLQARSDVEERVEASLSEMPLYELRAARRLTQQQLAKTLDLTQAAVSQMEHRTDVYLSTLENFVEAMGGHLEIFAVFGDGKIKLTHATDDVVRRNLGKKSSGESEKHVATGSRSRGKAFSERTAGGARGPHVKFEQGRRR